jgi:hypothetical protein
VPALACRIYRGPDGPSGVPDFGVIRRAIQQAAGVPAEDDGGRPGRPLGRG